MEQLRAGFIIAGNEEGNAEGPAHDGLLAVGALTEAKREIADGLGAALDAERLIVVEGMALALNTGVLDHGASVGLKAGHGTADVAVDLDNLLNGRGLEEGRGDALLNTENDTFGCGDADGCGTELDGFERVFDLEEATFGGEGVDSPI